MAAGAGVTSIVLVGPRGIEQTTEPHLLPPEAAVDAVNVDVRRRSWRGVPALRAVASLSGAATAVPVTSPSGQIQWLPFDELVSLVESPIVDDAHDRVYWTNEVTGGAYYARRLDVGSVAWKLGVPAPSPAPSVVVTGGSGPTVDRSYVYCWRTTVGELGPPSPPTLVSGPVDGVWTISGWAWPPSVPCAPIVGLNIYRTVYSPNASTYRLVAQLPVGTNTYVDNVTDTELAYREPLATLFAGSPPPGLRGLVRHPAGFLAGFVGRSVYLSEPWQPHAWPPIYVYSIPHNVTALAVTETGLVVCTVGRAFLLAGSHPSSMQIYPLDFPLRVASPRAVVSWRGGAVAATRDGLVLLTPQGAASLTQQVYLPHQWREAWTEQAMVAADQDRIVVLLSQSRGLLFQQRPTGDIAATRLVLPNIDAVIPSALLDRIWLLHRSTIYELAPEEDVRLDWSWVSKPFRAPKPTNFGVAQVAYRVLDEPHAGDGSGPSWTDWNDLRWTYDYLDVLDGYPLGGEVMDAALAEAVAGSTIGTPPLQPLGGEPLWQIASSVTAASGVYGAAGAVTDVMLRVWADEQLVFEQLVAPNEVYRLPSGFRATDWSVELIGGGRTEVFYVAIGTTIEDLKQT